MMTKYPLVVNGFKNTLNTSIKKLNIGTDTRERLVLDRSAWRTASTQRCSTRRGSTNGGEQEEMRDPQDKDSSYSSHRHQLLVHHMWEILSGPYWPNRSLADTQEINYLIYLNVLIISA